MTCDSVLRVGSDGRFERVVASKQPSELEGTRWTLFLDELSASDRLTVQNCLQDESCCEIEWSGAQAFVDRSTNETLVGLRARKDGVDLDCRRFGKMFERSPDAYALIDDSGILECNDAAVRLFGVDRREDLIGRALWDLSPELQPDGWTSLRKAGFVKELARRSGTYRFDWLHLTRSGYEFPVEISFTPIELDGRRVTMAIWHDVTDRTTNERQLMELAEELQLANVSLTRARDEALASARAKSAFLATMSHEIRTPLNGILGMARLLQGSQLSEEQVVCVDTIRSSGAILLRVISDILDLSKMEAGKMSIDPTPNDLVKTVREVVTLFLGQATEKGISLKLDTHGEEVVPVLCDAVRLKQIIGNLVGNAVKFTQQGRVQVDLTILRADNTCQVRIDVTDTGIGIPLDRQQMVFESFTQADPSSQRMFGGTGLGLAICRKLAALMDGEVTVLSEPGEGSRFTFSFAVPAASEASLTNDQGDEEAHFAGARVLLAEDNAVNVMVAERHLKALGCSVVVARNGSEALERATSESFDIIFMDMQMPQVDGIQATRMIRAQERRDERVAIVALTANVSPEDRAQCAAAGMDDFIEKPLVKEALAQVLRKFTYPNLGEQGDWAA